MHLSSDEIIVRDMFNSVFRGSRNFMTPGVIKYGRHGKYAYELSTGSHFMGSKPYGVTVLCNGAHDHEASRCFFNLNEAERYIKSLGEEEEE